MADVSHMSDEQLNNILNQAPNQVGTAIGEGGQPWTPMLIGCLTGAILIFALITMIFMVKALKNHDASDVLRLFTVPQVVVAALLLVILGFSNQQMTPVIGLLGTLVGYILSTGRQRQPPPSQRANPIQRKPEE
jgi:hypothetical protein